MADWFLLRGLTREKRHWNEFPSQLEKRWPGSRALMLDLPGFGSENGRPSPRRMHEISDDLRARYLALRPAPGAGFIALSLGGMVALDWCARYADDFQHLVLVNTSTADLSMPWQRMQLGVVPTLVGSRLSRDPLTKERAVLWATSAVHGMNEAVAKQWADYARESPPHPRAGVRQILASLAFKMPAAIKAKTLVITAKADQLCSPSCGAAIAQRLGATHREHPTGGHDLSLDDPDWLLAEIERFTQQQRSESAA